MKVVLRANIKTGLKGIGHGSEKWKSSDERPCPGTG
jgi:hypothetical protein